MNPVPDNTNILIAAFVATPWLLVALFLAGALATH